MSIAALDGVAVWDKAKIMIEVPGSGKSTNFDFRNSPRLNSLLDAKSAADCQKNRLNHVDVFYQREGDGAR